ncbi:hypothetical protein P0136_12585 [Lentisphaerota bacterium ZTH]|nr:hypothetical protein JYG24_09900 [Lentisphaerota bacterium]WET06195.1 hypothetical protein P0136_12585 [Lentisphaerota bacterium ZTH]
MKSVFLYASIAAAALVAAGCVSSGTQPQKVVLHPRDGSNVIIKNYYDLPLVENKKLGEVRIGDVFSPLQDNISGTYSISMFKMSAGRSSAMFQIESPQCIIAMSGSGKLQANEHSIVLKRGQVIYIPGKARISLINDTRDTLVFLTIGSPPVDLSKINIIGAIPKTFKIEKQPESMLRSDMPVQSVSEPAKIPKNIQEQLNMDKYNKELDQTFKDPFLNPKAYPLKMPDDPEQSLDSLLKQQTETLIPPKPQKGKKTDLQHVQELEPGEKDVPISPNN